MIRRLLSLLAICSLVLAIVATAAPAQMQGADDFAAPGGWFYSQANGKGGGGDVGFTITDNDGIPFWQTFQDLGEVPVVGYPISGRFMYKGFVTQAFQKLVFQWQPDSETVDFVNVFDELSAAGQDDWLLQTKSIPKSFDWSSDAGKSWDDVVASHQAILDENRAVKDAYFGADDPIAMNGLPMATQDFGNVYVVRAQRTSFQQWKEAVPWAAAGEVVTANGGQIAAEAALWPAAALIPSAPGGGQDPTPALSTPTPVPTAVPGQGNCAGDERMYFDPEQPVSGQQIQIRVSSRRASTNVNLAGPAGPQFTGAVETNGETTWTWTIAPSATGRYDFNFTVNGQVCTANFVEVGSGPTPTPTPSGNVCSGVSYALSDDHPDSLTPFRITIIAPSAEQPVELFGAGLSSSAPNAQVSGNSWVWQANPQQPGEYSYEFRSNGQSCLTFTVAVD